MRKGIEADGAIVDLRNKESINPGNWESICIIMLTSTTYIRSLAVIFLGDLAGMLHKDAEEHYPGVYFNTLEMDSPFPGGESPRDFYSRISTVFENLFRGLEENTLKSNVLLITHGGVINILYYLLENREWSNQSSFYPMGNTSVHTVEKGRHGWKLSNANVLSHLD